MVRRRHRRMWNDYSSRRRYRRDRNYTSLYNSLRSWNEEYYSPNYWHYGSPRRHDFRYNRDYDWRLREFEREGGEDAMRLRNERDGTIRRERGEDERIEREEGWRAGNRQVKVVGVDLHIKENSERHYTDKYELTQKERGRELVIRRGEPFMMTIILDSRYDNRVHNMTVNFHLGKNPDHREGTMKSLPVNESKFEPDRPYDWYVRVRNVHEKKLTLEVLSPCTCIIGEWSLSIDILVKSSRGDKPDRYHHPDDINILLNPWCIYDEVYFPETALLSEYILNDQGCVFNGSATHPSARPWNFGQFEDGILETCFRLLRKGNGYQSSNRLSNPVEIARMISHLVNLGDDGEETGILVGNWSGDYRGGTAPTQWNGSAKILKQYERNNGEPVKFGQCWVFSGVTVTICRAIGLPCKSVSCYGSAHDTDKSTTIDEYYVYQNGNYVKSPEMSSDSIWNFHVWNEIYCRRTDLHNRKYDGWQVIDSTPQELSDDLYACGPCSLKAVKNGDVAPQYDGKFVFAEVNADVVVWILAHGHRKIMHDVDKTRVGKLILSKNPDGRPFKAKSTIHVADIRAHDVTKDYKHAEGSLEERMSVRNAGNSSNENRGVRFEKKMIEVSLEDIGDVMIGSDFLLKFHFKNRGNQPFTLGDITVQTFAMKYTGEITKKFMEDTFAGKTLRPGSDDLFPVHVEARRYMNYLEDQHNMQVSISTSVQENRELVTKTFDFRLRRPDINVEFKTSRAKRGERVEVTLHAKMPITVTDCQLSLDGAGFDWSKVHSEYNVGSIQANSYLSGKIEVVPKHRGEQQLIVEFESRELHDITGHSELWVE